MSPRGEAVRQLSRANESTHPEHGQKRALTGIGWALLDLADAIRESKGDG